MGTIKMSRDINHDRRRFLGTAAMTVAAAQLGMIGSADRAIQHDKPGGCDFG